MNFNRKPIFGVGVNDADYSTLVTETILIDGVKKRRVVFSCPYYVKWKGMIERCYSDRYQEKQPTYIGCTVCDEWLVFSSFRFWMVEQETKSGGLSGMHLDKDILGSGKYSPEHCVFVHRKVNNFISEGNHKSSSTMIGCVKRKERPGFEAFCGNPISGKQEYIGVFDTEVDAHNAWRGRKRQCAIELANSDYVNDERVKCKLLSMYK